MKILSLGLGVQSTLLYYLSSKGVLPRVDYAVFADPGGELKETYQYLQYLLTWSGSNDGIPIIVNKEKNLYEDLQNPDKTKRFASIPAFTKNPDGTTGMLKRQCTNEYKIEVVDQVIRMLYGLKKGKRTPITEIWKGITLDEIDRVIIPQSNWRHEVYPFINYRVTKKYSAIRIDWGMIMTRTDCEAWYRANNIPLPPKSACKFCPYINDAGWIRMKTQSPGDFEDAVRIDKSMREGRRKTINPTYLHRSLKPLDQVIFNAQDNGFFGECSGNCHL